MILSGWSMRKVNCLIKTFYNLCTKDWQKEKQEKYREYKKDRYHEKHPPG